MNRLQKNEELLENLKEINDLHRELKVKTMDKLTDLKMYIIEDYFSNKPVCDFYCNLINELIELIGVL